MHSTEKVLLPGPVMRSGNVQMFLCIRMRHENVPCLHYCGATLLTCIVMCIWQGLVGHTLHKRAVM